MIVPKLGVGTIRVRMASGRGFPAHHALLSNCQKVATVLGQQVERVGDVRNIFDVTVLEALAVQGFE